MAKTKRRNPEAVQCKSDARQSGSAILLAVVVVVLLALMGAGYLQMAHVSRRSTAQMDTAVGEPRPSIIAFIRRVLRDDVMRAEDEQGNRSADFFPEDDYEPYDFPWTNKLATAWEVYNGLDQTTLGNAQGDIADDTWLSSIIPNFAVPANPVWEHLTNLRGIYLLMPSAASGNLVPLQMPTVADAITSSTWWNDTNVPIVTSTAAGGAALQSLPVAGYEMLGADADGDGIPDSKWQWAPLAQEMGQIFVMAVAIRDSSALHNIQVHTVLYAGGYDTSTAGVNAPHWLWPGELDLGALLDDMSGTTALGTLMNYRMGAGSTITPFIASNATTRWWHWLDGNRLWGNYGKANDLTAWNQFVDSGTLTPPSTSYQKFNSADEIELRWKDGLNSDTLANVESSGFGSHAIMRTTEIANADYTTSFSDMADFFANDPRKLMTTYSGAATFNQIDINNDALSEIVTIAQSAFAGTPAYPAGISDVATFSNQFAACVRDWADKDNAMTQLGNQYGMEYLPFLTEVYVQGRYDGTNPPPVDTSAGGDGSQWEITWALQGNIGYAIEIRNPVTVDVDLTTVHLWVTFSGNTADWGLLSDIAGQDTLAPTEVLIVYRNGNNANNDPDDIIYLAGGTSMITEEGGHTYLYASVNKDWPQGTGDATVELRGTSADDAAITTPYATMPSKQVASSIIDSWIPGAPGSIPTMTPPTATKPVMYGQVWAKGNADPLAMMMVQVAAASNTLPTMPANPVPPTASTGRNTSDHRLGEVNKGVAAPSGFADQFAIGNLGRIYHVGDLARMVIIGPTTTQTVAERFEAAGATSFADLMLDFDDAGTVGSGNKNINHAQYLLSRLTTLNPLNDGQNNDGFGGKDNDTENLVAGMINANTATAATLERALPIPNDTLRQNVAAAIVAARNAPSRDAAKRKGLAYLWELYAENPGVFEDALGSDGTSNDALGSTRIDFNEELGGASVVGSDVVSDDQEERTMLMKWLSQVLSTRSDVFVAYILVRGYDVADFSTGPVGNDIRLVAVFDRSNLGKKQTLPRVLAVARVE